jgi:cilia- and flagella-associated protein 57
MKSKDRDIGEMERNIYELKKKTQELEKFKFVLDYKIKELKRDINPREEEIQKLKKQTNKMDKKLKQFNRVNAHLGLMVKDLQEKQAKMQSGITNERNKLRENANKIKRMKDDVYETVQFIDNHEKLRECVAMLLKKYSIDENRSAQIDTDIQKEYTNQREYLQDSVKVLKQRLAKDSEIHRQVHKQTNRFNL